MGRSLLFLLVGLILGLGVGSCRGEVPVVALVPDVVLVLVLYLGVTPHRAATSGAVVALLLGYVMDLTAAAPKGLFGLTYVAFFYLGRLAQSRFLTTTRLFEILFALVAGLLSGIVTLFVRALAAPHVGLRGFGTVLFQAVATAIVAPVIFSLGRFVDRRTSRVPDHASRDVLEVPFP